MPPMIAKPACADARLTNPSSTTAVTKGQAKLFGEGLTGIATEAIAAGAVGNWIIPFGAHVNVTMHTTGYTAVVGDYAYLIAASHVVTTISSSNTRIGIFLTAPAASGATAEILFLTK